MSSFPEEAFRRTDEAPDEELYRTPRLVTHIDDQAHSRRHTTVQRALPGGRGDPRSYEQLRKPPAAGDRVPAGDWARYERGGASAVTRGSTPTSSRT